MVMIVCSLCFFYFSEIMMEDWGALVDKQEKTLVDKVQMFIYQILFLISV